MFNQYGKHLEQATAAQVHAITWGEQENNQPPNPESSGEDGLGESNTDDQAQAPTQGLPQPNSNLLLFRPQSDPQGSMLKCTTNEEGNEHGNYVWNWKKPGGGPPWRDNEEGSISVVNKTYLLQNIYTINIK